MALQGGADSSPTGLARRSRHGIGFRLGAAFVTIVGLAVGACIVGWLSYVSLSGELSQIARSQMPRLAFATRLSKTGADISSVMPNLASSPTRSGYTAIRAVYAQRLDTLNAVLAEMQAADLDNGEFGPLVESINRNLSELDIASGRRFTLQEEMRADLDELRWVQTDLLGEAEPLVDDVRFNMETELKADAREARILNEQRKSEALMSVIAQASLATGLIARLVDLNSVEDIQETIAYLGDSTDALRLGQQTLADWPDSITVRQLAERILSSADVTAGLPHTKRSELIERGNVQALANENRRLVEELGQRIGLEVGAAQASGRLASERAERAIATGSGVLLAIAVLSVAAALAIGYFYVHRNLLARIRALAESAFDISAGQPGATMAVSSRDELGDLASALNVFRHTRDELIQSAKLAALGQMAAGIGHELKQPLAAIRSHTHNGGVLIERGDPDKAMQSLEKIGQLTQRMSNQIGHLRRFARLPDSRIGPVDLAAAVEGATSLLAHRFQDEDAVLTVSLQEALPLVIAEGVRLEQVFVNLIANAMDAVAGRDERTIRLTARSIGERVEITVEDTGGGIVADDVNVIFDPFFTTKPPSSGLGLGLSITYNILKDFGGGVTVLRTSPEGTSFLVTLRAAADDRS
ncbi:ATP-binding protein [Mesorhizobium sp. ZMM04-5]|uniref:histidine kinase n=1 Tax=Mesorhizobium marinum TaxID=3228790 RepID=A0ABV3R3P0_9HYPH